MPADKDAAKRRRQARNRQERENRQARTEGAKRAATRPSRTAEEVPTRSAKGAARGAAKGTAKTGATTAAKTDLSKSSGRPSRTAETSAPAPGGLMGKLFPPRPQPADGEAAERPARPVRVPSEVVEVDAGPGLRGLVVRLTAQPGGRATVLAFLVAVVSAVTLLAFPVWPSPDLTGYGETVVRTQLEADDAPEGEIDDAVEEIRTSSLESLRGIEFPPPGIYLVAMIAALPVIITAFAVRALTRVTRSRTLMWCAIAGGASVVLNLGTGIYFLLGVIALGFGAYQSAKADKAALAASA